MASLLKNHILKILSRFSKNLSSDKIKLSTLKGEGDLVNLELDENVLMELLDLPTWLLLKKAVCNKVSIRIQWTTLKSQPIVVMLDEVLVEIEALVEPRRPSYGVNSSYRSSSGKYGLIDCIIDGMSISINTVQIFFVAQTFKASIELSRLQVNSKMPNWKDAELKLTYIRDTARNQILLFKELVWETTRIEADGLQEMQVTPVRLIANTSRIRVTLKKRLSDCMILGSRVQMILDDLLWVLTVSQLEASILFLKSLQLSISKSAKQAKSQIQLKLQLQQQLSTTGDMLRPNSNSHSPRLASTSASGQQLRRLFDKYDVPETSYHVYTGRVDLHFCEEGSPGKKLSNNAVASGSIQVILYRISLDFYPYHYSDEPRTAWLCYNENSQRRNEWATQFMQSCASSKEKLRSTRPVPALMESTVVLNVEDLLMTCVTTMNSQQNKKRAPFLSSDKRLLKLPKEMHTIHLDITEYYNADGAAFPAPPSTALFVVLNPLHIRLDYETLVWLNAFGLNIRNNLAELLPQTLDSMPHDKNFASTTNSFNFRIEALMPRVILPAEIDISGQPERPTALQLQVSKLAFYKTKLIDGADAELAVTKQRFLSERAAFFLATENNNSSVNDGVVRFPHHSNDANINWADFRATEHPASPPSFANSPKEVWCLICEQIWAEFTGIKANRDRPIPFFDCVPINIWLSNHESSSSSSSGDNLQLSVLVDVADRVSLQITHFQYLFLMRLSDSLTKLQQLMEQDSMQLLNETGDNSSSKKQLLLTVALTVQHVRCSFVMPALSDMDGSLRHCESVNQFSLLESVDQPLEELTFTSAAAAQKSEAPLPPTPAALLQQERHLRSSPSILTCDLSCCPPSSSSSDSLIALSVPVIANTNENNSTSGRRATNPLNKLGTSLSRLGDRVQRVVTQSEAGSDPDLEDWVSVSGSEYSDEERLLTALDGELYGQNGYFEDHTCTPWETATEIAQEAVVAASSSSPQLSAGSVTSRGRDVVSVVAFHLEGVDCLFSSQKDCAILRLITDRVSVLESGNRHMEENMNSCSTALLHKTETVHTSPIDGVSVDSIPTLSVRLEMMESSTKASQVEPCAASTGGRLSVLLQHLTTQLRMSSIVNLAEFMEDEVLQVSLPMFIDARDMHITLNEDRQCPNLACPGHLPLRLMLPRFRLCRDSDNTLHFLPPDPADSSLSTNSATSIVACAHCSHCKGENADQLPSSDAPVALPSLAHGGDDLLTLLTYENSTLRNLVSQIHADFELYQTTQSQQISELQRERDSLVSAVQTLQAEIVSLTNARRHNLKQPPPPPF